MTKKVVGAVVAFVLGITLLVVAFLPFGGDAGPGSASVAAPTPSPSASADLEACRTDAINALLTSRGLKEEQYVIGVDNVDRSLPEFAETGALGFNDGALIDTREKLGDAFSDEDGSYRVVADTNVAKFTQYDRSEVLDPENWEMVQYLIPVQLAGNTGYAQGRLVDVGVRSSDIGDAEWIFIDMDTCEVPFATHHANGEKVAEGTPDNEKPYGSTRVGCLNPTDGIKPPPPPPPPPTEECPPGQTKNPNGVCVAPKSNDPDDYRAPGDGGKGQDVGTGTKPPVTETRPAQPTPDPVETSKPGGGGVVDSPTNPPSSETGVTAPGATPPPTTAPTPPPNEGGDFDEPVPEPEW